MPVRSLESYLFERGLVAQLPLDTLRNARLGIDVNHYINRVHAGKEPFADGIGGFPVLLRSRIESDLVFFKEHNITPVFVFSGDDIVETYNSKASKESTASERQRAKAWSSYDSIALASSSIPEPATVSFRDFTSPFSVDTISLELMKIFNENDIEYIRAPFLSWVQLGYLYHERLIDTIYGPTETLLLDVVDKFVFGVDDMAAEIKFVDRGRVLEQLSLAPYQLLEIAVSVGCDLQLTTLPIYGGFPPAAIFDIGVDIAHTGGIYNQIVSLGNGEILAKFQKGIVALRHMPVVKKDGRVDSLSPPESLPSDLHDVIGQRLPHEYYFYQSIGLIQPKVLEAIAHDKYVERVPLDGGSIPQYKSLVKALVSVKNKEMNLLTQNMHRFHQFKKLRLVKYFEATDTDIENKKQSPVYFSFNNIIAYSDKAAFTMSEFINLLTSTSIDTLVTFPIKQSSKLLVTEKEIISTSLLRTLHALDLFSPKTSTKWAEAFKIIPSLDSRFQESYTLFISFVKLTPFSFHDTFALPGGSLAADTSDRDAINILARLLCFLSVTQNKTQYNGPVSHALLAFRSCLELVRYNVRELLECVLVNSLSNGEVEKIERTNKDWQQLAMSMPFGSSAPSTVLALIGQTLLDNASVTGDYAAAKASVLTHFSNPTFGLFNVTSDLKDGFTFAKECIKILECLNKNGLLPSEQATLFEKAGHLCEKTLSTFQ